MEFGETDKVKLQVQIPWIPTTPSKSILPICTSGEPKQLSPHFNGEFACFDSSASTELNISPHHRPPPAAAVTNIAHDNARTRVQISFDNISSSSNGIAELLAQANAPSAYYNATHGFWRDQFVPSLSSQFNQNYALLSHHHLSREQPLINTIYDNYQDPQGKGN